MVGKLIELYEQVVKASLHTVYGVRTKRGVRYDHVTSAFAAKRLF